VSDSVTAFSDVPLRAGAAGGVLLLVVALILLLAGLFSAPDAAFAPGWLLVAASVFAVGGVNLLMLGVMGEYLWRALDEARQRPRWVVERPLGHDARLPTDAPEPGQAAVE
jgi:dolichol-phosphate mannosyltransferase